MSVACRKRNCLHNRVNFHMVWTWKLSYFLTVLKSCTLICRIQYIPRNMHTVFALLCFVVVIHWLIFPYPSGLLLGHCGNLTIAPVPAKQPWWIWINTSCEFIMNDCITTTKQSTTKPCAYFLGYTVHSFAGNDWFHWSNHENGMLTSWHGNTFRRVTGPCITNVIATCRKNFSQWESSFLWKLRCHWLKFLRRVAKTLVIQGPGPLWCHRSPSQYCGSFHVFFVESPKKLLNKHVIWWWLVLNAMKFMMRHCNEAKVPD